MSAITDPSRIKATDPGHPDICNIYQYQRAFNQLQSGEIEQSCRQGKIGCVACKKIAAQQIIADLQPIQEKRAYFQGKTSYLKDIFREGNKRTRSEGEKTMSLVREAMHFDYKNILSS
jgi:tryptophanyl-tRNA synthetase